MATYFITGASRGLGLELVKQLLATPNSKVIAGARKPSESKELAELHKSHSQALTLVALDVDNTASVNAAAQQITKSHPEGIDYLVNNAGILGGGKSNPDDFTIYNTNVAGPVRVINAFLPLIQEGKKKVVLNISSIMGSISLQSTVHDVVQALLPGADYLNYRVSKAGLNAAMTVLAAQHKADGIAFVCINPGLVTTDMLMGMKGNPAVVSAHAIAPTKSVEGMITVLHKLTAADSAKFYNYDGSDMAW